MEFEQIKILDMMIDFYQKPRDTARFKDYLQALTDGDNNKLELPIMSFNPMAKEHILEKLLALKKIDAEAIIDETLKQINTKIKDLKGETYKVVLNLPDDLKGSWTDFYTTDYQAKFQLKSLAKRGFCVPLFWASESYDKAQIKQNIMEFCYRTHYFTQNPVVETLEGHIKQEVFVAQNSGASTSLSPQEFKFLNEFFQANKTTTILSTILNFFYSDAASEKLGYPLLGIKIKMAGFEFAKVLASQKQKI